MATAGRTARGLRRVPDTRPRRKAPAPQPRRREPVREKHRVFSRGRVDMPLLILILVLLAIGLVMLFSASYANSYYYEGNSYYYITRQGIFAVIGVVVMLAVSCLDHSKFEFWWKLVFWVTVFLLALLLVCRYAHIESLAPPQGSATRWLDFGLFTFQPSEIAKFAVIITFAHMISRNEERMGTFWFGVLPYAAILGLFALLIYLEDHLSGTLIVLAIGAILMFVGGTKPRWFVIGGVAVGALLLFVVMSKGGYQMSRITAWLDPWSTEVSPDATYQTRQSLYAIGSGGLLGVGLGQSRQKYLWLPEPQNDFIFAVVCEELGLVGALVIIVLFAMFIWRGVYVSIHARDRFGMLLGLGVTFQVGLQTVLNICVVTNTIPNTGIALPFFSYGGTALLVLLGEMGVLLSVSRSSSVEKT